MANIRAIRTVTRELADQGKLPDITIHMLFPVTNSLLNRDDTGAQKSAMLDVLRMRISSQAMKRPITDRLLEKQSLRTRQIASYICDRYRDEHAEISEEEWGILEATLTKLLKKSAGNGSGAGEEKPETEAAGEEADGKGKKEKKKGGKKVKVGEDPGIKTQILFFSMKDIEALYGAVNECMKEAMEYQLTAKQQQDLENGKGSDPRSDEAAKKIRKAMEETADSRGINPVIAMIGRMSTDSMLRTVYSALRVSHAYSVTRMIGETDFYTAVDDYQDPMHRFFGDACDASGAAQMDNKDINSAIMYVCYCINMRIFVENLMAEMEDLSQASVENVLKIAYETAAEVVELITIARPKANQTGMFSDSRPNAVAMLITDSHGKTADNAFQRVLPRDGADRSSIEKLRDWLDDDTFRPSYEHITGYWMTGRAYQDISEPAGYTRIANVRDLKEIVQKGAWL